MSLSKATNGLPWAQVGEQDHRSPYEGAPMPVRAIERASVGAPRPQGVKMQFVLNIFIILHFLGLALLFGGFIVQAKSAEKGVSRWMLDGALTQLVTGIIMVGIIESKVIDDMQPSSSFHAKIGDAPLFISREESCSTKC